MCLWSQIYQATLPVVERIIVGDIPGIVSYTVESQLGSLTMLHWVAHETTEILVGQVGLQTVGRTLHDDMTCIISYREVPPVISWALDTGVHPVERLAGQVTTYHITCPEYIDRWIKGITEDSQRTGWFWIRPETGIIGRTHHERCNIALSLHKLLSQAVQEFRLLHWVGTLAGNIIKEDSERTYTEVVHQVELVNQVLIVFLVPLDILSRMDSPYEIYTVATASLYEFADVLSLFLRIRQAPVRAAVIRIILWTIEIGVHLVLSIIIDEGKTHLMRPRLTIEAFYHTTVRKIRVVVASGIRHLALCHLAVYNLAQGLQAIESTTLIVSHNLDTLGISPQAVSTRYRLHSCFSSKLLTEINSQANALGVSGQELHIISKLTFLVNHLDTLLQVESVSSIHIQEMWCRTHNESVMIQFLTRNHVHVLLFRTLAAQVLCLSALCKSCHQHSSQNYFSSHNE